MIRWCRLFCAVGICAMLWPALGADDRTTLAIEALLRIQATNLNDNPKLQQAVTNLLVKSRGTPNFVKLVEKFHLTDQTEGLLEIALAGPGQETGIQAVRMILSSGDVKSLERALASTNVDLATKMAAALGNAGKQEAAALLLPLAVDTARAVGLRKQAVRSLAQTAAGATAVLELAREGKLPEDLTFTASSELNRVAWPEIRSEAAKLLPAPATQNAEPLPSLGELLRMKGDPAAGARVFAGPTAACATCHRVRGQGAEVGPDLSEIGAKLGKDALYDAILDPSAGISFGYEAWQFTLASGEEVFGLIASETSDELALKAANGVVTRYRKSEVVEREQMALSIMPAGLQQGMTVRELIDLVEYLASLTKPGDEPNAPSQPAE